MTGKWPTHDMWFDELSVRQEIQENLKLYRFMNLQKFESLLKESKLFFARASVLSDKFEGGYLIPGLEKESIENRNSTFVSCWTKNDPQIESSVCMWKPLSNEENHIAIGISIDKFFSGLFQDKTFEKYIGNINYLDPDNVVYPENYKANSLVPFFLKRNYFNYEKEIRIVIQDMDPNGHLSFNAYQELSGIPVPIDLEKIDEIIVSPEVGHGFYNKVNRLIKKAKLKKTVKRVSKSFYVDPIKVSKEIECMNKHNNRQLDSVDKSNYCEHQNINYGTLEGNDASGNFYVVETLHESNHESGSYKKKVIQTIQQCQCYNRKNFVCHRLTNLYFMYNCEYYI